MLPFVLGGAALVLILMVVGVVLLIRTVGSDSPRDVAEAYMEAVEDRDAGALRNLVCNEHKDDAAEDVPSGNNALVSWEIVSDSESGDSATVKVRVTVRVSGETNTATLSLKMIKEDGEWRICDIGVG